MRWLCEAKVGDLVAVPVGLGAVSYHHIVRVTPTLVVLDDGSRWRKCDGYEHGGLHRSELTEAVEL